MNDITKARYYLKCRDSDLQHLTSFGSMFSTAEESYKNVRLQIQRKLDTPGSLDKKSIEAAVDYAVLKYMKKYNRLPTNITALFSSEITLEQKLRLAERWVSE